MIAFTHAAREGAFPPNRATAARAGTPSEETLVIEKAQRGLLFMTPGPLVGEPEWQVVRKTLRLSDREFQIVRAAFDGLREPAIARELGISTHTVHTYVTRMYCKLGVSDRSQLLLQVFAVLLSHRAAPVLGGVQHKGRAIASDVHALRTTRRPETRVTSQGR